MSDPESPHAPSAHGVVAPPRPRLCGVAHDAGTGGRTMLIAHLTDTHIVAPGERLAGRFLPGKRLSACIDAINGLEPMPDCVVLTGDLTHHGTETEYAELKRLLSALRAPFYLLPGNHDATEPLRKTFFDHAYLSGADPRMDYALRHKAIRLVALDTRVPGQSGGMVRSMQAAWLDRALRQAPEQLTLLLMHHPPIAVGIPALDAMACANAQALACTLSAHSQVRHILCGHVHRLVHGTLAGTPVTVGPSSAHAIALSFEPGTVEPVAGEGPGFCLYRITEGGEMTVHAVYALAQQHGAEFGSRS